MTKNNDYRDYVIKEGKLIGEFEKMYQECEDPWEQTKEENSSIDKKIAIELLKKYKRKRIIEYGCGFGQFTSLLQKDLGSALGIDISETAISKAKTRYPDCEFKVGDLLDDMIVKEYNPDAILMVEITWYVLEKISKFKGIMLKNFGGGDVYFVHLLTTFSPGVQQYGREYFTNLDEITEYWSDVVDILEWGKVSNKNMNGGARTFFIGKIK